MKKDTVLNQVKKDRGFVRPWQKILVKKDPKMLEDYHNYYISVYRKEALSPKIKELIMVCVDAVQKWPGIEVHLREALRLGVKGKEILEALEVAGISGGIHTMIYGLMAFDKVSKEMERVKPKGGRSQ